MPCVNLAVCPKAVEMLINAASAVTAILVAEMKVVSPNARCHAVRLPPDSVLVARGLSRKCLYMLHAEHLVREEGILLASCPAKSQPSRSTDLQMK